MNAKNIESAVQRLEGHLDLSNRDCENLEGQMLDCIAGARDGGDITQDQALEFSDRVLNAIQICRDRNSHGLGIE